ncbi:MAG TPA: FG-GAP-like repeat-containing protein [Candidatus Methanoperedens sp.]|nr:FG-GAP-like repeat-containing protein [Candidatus Methanoperedens sp.]
MSILFLLMAAYGAILFALFIYGNNCLLMAYLYTRRKKEKIPDAQSGFPIVTIQLPVYNELYVVERLIRQVAKIDYPGDRLEIQVLDDSTDETTGIIERCIKELRCRGLNIYSLHRNKRDGYKAGALRDGMKCAKGEFIAVFDADFIPDPDFLKKCIPYFSDPSVGMVQTRWGHINEDYSLLTRILAIGIDGHFLIEQGARHSKGLFLNFNGTAGIWRKRCIDESGGWQDDTLTEDLDLSYRAQLLGWKLVFLDDVVSPAEVPVQINALKRQQFRWAKGSIQCAKKLLPEVMSADIPGFKKMQAVLHLTYYSVHPLMVALLLLSLPLIYLTDSTFIDLRLFTIGSFGPLMMYALSQKELYRDWKSRLKYLPMLTVLGIGISVNNTRAVIEALLNRKGIFQRTPKFGIERDSDRWEEKKYRLSFPLITFIELGLGIYALFALYLAYIKGNYFLIPFLVLYVAGYLYIFGLTLLHSRLQFQRILLVGILAAAFLLRLYRTTMGDLSEDPYHHWLISANMASGGGFVDPMGNAVLWLPGYHIMASGLILIFGSDIFWLKFANIFFSLGSICLAYLIAGRYSMKAGLLAASFLALNPFDILISSTAYTEPMAVFFFLVTVHLIENGREKAAGIALLLASATRYEVWLALPFLLYWVHQKQKNIWYFIAPSLGFILLWSGFALRGLIPLSILGRSKDVLDFEIRSGAVHQDTLSRTLGIVRYFFISSLLVYAAGIYHAAKNMKKSGIHAFALFSLAVVFLGTGLGIFVGSFRYFSLAVPLLCIFAGVALSKTRWLWVFVLASLAIALPFYFNLFSGLDVLYMPLIRAGEYVGGASGVISNSPMPLYYSGLPLSHLFGAAMLRNMTHEQGIRFLEENRVEYLVYVDSPEGEFEKVFPGIEKGKDIPGLGFAYDPGGWEYDFGGKRVYVYKLVDGLFRNTGSYISSSPLLEDLDGDGYSEIIAASDMLYVWKRDGTLMQGFPAKTGGLIASTPAVLRTKEGSMIFVGSDDDWLYAWWYNGSSVPGFPVRTGGDVFSRPLIVDMDGDGDPEVVAGSDDGNVYAWHMNGSAVKGWPVHTQGYVSSSPVASDLDGDMKPEIIAGSWDRNLYVWRGDGSLVSGFPYKTGDAIWATPQVADLDGDGKPEIIAASDMVYALNSRGELLPGFPMKTGSYIVSSPLVHDIDHDGSPEIIVASDSLYVFDRNGTLKNGFPVYTGHYFWASPSIADLDRDGMSEIVIGDWGGKVYAFKPDGSVLAGFPKQTGGKIFASAAIGDIENDGSVEIVAGSWDRNIYLWNAGRNDSFRMEQRILQKSEAPVFLNSINVSQENGVNFIAADLTGYADEPKISYYAEKDGSWHLSPMMLDNGMYTGMIEPLRQDRIKYYISLENGSYRFPQEGFYEIRN